MRIQRCKGVSVDADMKNQKIKTGYKRNIMRILTIFFVVFPWITHLKILNYSEMESAVFGGYDGQAVDLFLYYKEIAVIVFAVFLIIWFAGEHIFVDKVDKNVPLIQGKNKCLFILAGIFCFMVIISTLFSQNRKTALWGSPTEGEGLFVLIGYVILMLAFYNYSANTYGMKLLKKAVYAVSGLTIVLSMAEFFYGSLLQNGLVQQLAGLKQYADAAGTAGIEKLGDAVSLSFYNPSYYGGFVCILLPFMLSFGLSAEKKWEMLTAEIMSACLMFCVMASNSTTALYIAIFEIVLLVLFYMVKGQKRRTALFRLLLFLPIFLIAAALYSFFADGNIFGILRNANSATGKVSEKRFEIEEIVLKENNVLLKGKEAGLDIIYADGQIRFTGEEGNELNASYEENIFSFSEPAYENVIVELVLNSTDNTEILAKILVDAGYDDTVDFYILKDGTLSGVGQNGSIIKDIGAEKMPEGLKKYYGIFTGRGYAWLHSLPILKKTLLKGVGPGNFAFYFKQQDYVGMLQTHKSTKYIIDKPHNSYLQFAIQDGLVGMLAFFGLLVFALIKAVRVYVKGKKPDGACMDMHMGGMVSLAGFLGYSMINDSIITVTPIMCMVVGIVLAADFMSEQ